jgi:HD superfamily phosphohydrolases
MAMAYLVYPGAVHTRLNHALGAYHLMYRTVRELSAKGIDITPEERQAVLIAILLHDIGHGPFSHALEHTLLQVSHESLSIQIMELLNDEMNGALTMAIQIFKNQYHKPFLHELVSSQLDMDRLDYLARDSYYSGVSEGVIGYDRIIKMLTVHQQHLVVEENAPSFYRKILDSKKINVLASLSA